MLTDVPPVFDFLLIALVGVVVGFISGVFGVGGGFLIVPVLNIALGLPMQIAVGSAACQVLGPATTCLLARRMTIEDLRLPAVIFGGLLVGVIAGTDVLRRATEVSPVAAGEVSQADWLVLSTYFVVLFVLGSFSIWEGQRALSGRPVTTGWLADCRISPVTTLWGQGGQQLSVPVIALFGLIVGFIAGLLGIGGALLLLPGMIYVLGIPWQRAVGSSMIIVWLVTLQSTIAHAWLGNVRLPIVIALLLGGTIGARLGVEMSASFDPARARRSFGWLALATAVAIAVRLVGMWWARGMIVQGGR